MNERRKDKKSWKTKTYFEHSYSSIRIHIVNVIYPECGYW